MDFIIATYRTESLVAHQSIHQSTSHYDWVDEYELFPRTTYDESKGDSSTNIGKAARCIAFAGRDDRHREADRLPSLGTLFIHHSLQMKASDDRDVGSRAMQAPS